ncbi:hypothetical protein HUN08_12420 [Gordonia sp. X0973]|uniref:hypothetical protein n=1 Tax=Gordonia sp. X0973 TaxID=2742602 RepID=UPI0013EAE197|nr:hypothetical protein [Gordonia sp. X0973]QKT07900.1 hypothetical protein HUN08_12420 [Gordonia sp. X0973]
MKFLLKMEVETVADVENYEAATELLWAIAADINDRPEFLLEPEVVDYAVWPR